MEKIYAAITAVGAHVPEFRLTNEILETMVDTNSAKTTKTKRIKK
jgi:3-oxoacyl-[acyl-carrier-protein] synthase-3